MPFIEYLVVELDYGKMSTTDLSSFDTASTRSSRHFKCSLESVALAQVFGSSYQQPTTPVAEESTGICVVSPGVRDLLCSLLLGRLTVLDSSCAAGTPLF